MVANVRGYTPNYEFRLINFDTPRWHTLEYANWNQLDAMLLSAGIAQVRGEWQHSTLYRQGDRVFDGVTNEIYRCILQHTSPASGTFAEDRIANPNRWVLQLPGTPVFMGPWTPNTEYKLGDIAHDDYRYFLCDNPHLSRPTFDPTEQANWQLIFDATDAVSAAEGFADDAEDAAGAASTSASQAATSATNAQTSATNADTSEANALQYQSNASAYASNAQTYMNNALAYAEASSNYADNAGDYANTANDSAQAAALSATQANNSAQVIQQANAFPWAYDVSTVMVDPGPGYIRLNSASFASVTQIAISHQTVASGNPSVANWIMSWDDSNATVRGQIILREYGTPHNFAIYNVVGNITVNGTAGIVPVAYVSHANSFDVVDMINVEFTRSGNDGTSGSGSGDMLKANNLSDVQSVPTSRTNLGLGSNDTPTFSGLTATAPIVLPAAAPTLGTHAANKTYVDGRVADTGDTMTGDLIITSPTASNSNITGALQVTGGVGVQGRMNVGGQFIANANSVQHTFGSQSVSGYAKVSLTGSNNANSAPILSLYRAGVIEHAFNVQAGATLHLSSAFADHTDTELIAKSKFSWTNSGIFTALLNVASNDVNTGAIVSKGGLGVAGNANIGGTLNALGAVNVSGLATIKPPTGYGQLTIDNTAAASQASIHFKQGGVTKWQLGKQTDDSFFLYDLTGSQIVFTTSANGSVLTYNRPIALPADPASAMHAATKQYVDSKASVNKPAFIAVPSTTQNILNETWTKLNFAIAALNQGSYFNTTNSRWTPPVGTIHISANIYFTSGLLMGTPIGVGVYKNGSLIRQSSIGGVATYGAGNITITDICNGTDFYEIYTYIFTATNAVYAANSILCNFQGEHI